MSDILRHEDYGRRARYDAQVLVIGTGAGGACVGAELAEAGLDVLFVEEGSYHPTSSFNPYMQESIPRLYRDGGTTVIFGKPPIPYVEGRAVGGSTVINGGMCYRTPDNVLDEWVEITGAEELSPKALEPYFERVEDRIQAKPQHEVSVGDDNRLMAAGARKMGWTYSTNQRNQESCVGANSCVLGCPTGAKQSTLVSYMPRAMSAGARCLTEVRITDLIIERGRCVGARGHSYDPRTRKKSGKVEIRAKAVVVSCGAVQTPFLLLKHRLGRPSKQLGKNFVCHPNAKVGAYYPHDVRGWQGVSQWGQIREFHDEGLIFAENFIPAGAFAGHLPVHGDEAWELMQRYNNAVVSGVLVEDSNSGRVSRRMGMAWARYDITDWDHHRFIKGVKLLSTMHFEMGADFVVLPFSNMHIARSVDELAQIDEKTVRPENMELFTPHLMGSCRMGRRPEDSVIGTDGQIWDLPGCYVADASVFPTPIGVNPQITIMALATLLAGKLVDRMTLGSRRAA